MDELCANVILGQDVMKSHEKVIFKIGGSCKPILINKVNDNYCCVTQALVTPPHIFHDMLRQCKPITTKSLQYNAVKMIKIS